MNNYILPILLVLLFLYALIKKVNVYKSFVEGAKSAVKLVLDIFPYIVAIMVAISLFRISGLCDLLIKAISPIFNLLGIPNEVCELVLLKPFTGSGSFAILNDILKTYGADSYIGRCASVIASSSETLFYVASVYFAKTSVKRLGWAIVIGIIVSIVSSIVACLVCKVI